MDHRAGLRPREPWARPKRSGWIFPPKKGAGWSMSWSAAMAQTSSSRRRAFFPPLPEGVDLSGNHGRYIILGLWGAIGTQPMSPRDLTIKNLTIGGATFPKPRALLPGHAHGCRVPDRVPLGCPRQPSVRCIGRARSPASDQERRDNQSGDRPDDQLGSRQARAPVSPVAVAS